MPVSPTLPWKRHPCSEVASVLEVGDLNLDAFQTGSTFRRLVKLDLHESASFCLAGSYECVLVFMMHRDIMRDMYFV